MISLTRGDIVAPNPSGNLRPALARPCGFDDLGRAKSCSISTPEAEIETLLGAHTVGPAGRAVGLDITPQMVATGEELGKESGHADIDLP